MGITGLIPFLENASTPINVRELKGSSVAVDSYCWLHKGVFACAEKLIRGEKTDIYVNYCLKYVDMLMNHKIKVIMVFDGRHLPAKAETERRRREARQESKKLAKEYLRKNEIDKARAYMKRAVDVTHEMALQLIKACRAKGVDCIVAPYEADAQMAWLNKVRLAEYIITEDSDLTLFGAEKILFKLDLSGSALLVEKSKIPLTMGCRPEQFTFDKFRRMCILSGCDYLDSLPGIGLKKACKFMLTTEEDDMTKALKKLPLYLKMKQLNVSDEYIEEFLKAEATFKHMFVYNPLIRQMVRLCELDEFQTEEKYCSNAGTFMEDQEVAFQLALGNINPFSLKHLDDWHPDKEWFNTRNKNEKPKAKSIWCKQATEQLRQTICEDKNDLKAMFKKIEYKNMAEIEIREQLERERLKLEEVEVFTMYRSDPLATEKRKRSLESGDEEIEEKPISDKVVKTPSKLHNPFAINNLSCEENETKSHVCENNSLLKILSPLKESGENKTKINYKTIEVRSRFFSQNTKEFVSKTFAGRGLSEEMIKIEEKTTKSLEIQKTLYFESPPQGKAEAATNPNSPNFDEKPNEKDCSNEFNLHIDHEHQANESEIVQISPSYVSRDDDDVILLSEDESTSDQSNTALSQSSTSNCTRRLGLPKRQLSGRSTKKISIDTNQSTLNMFGFKKRPKL